MEWKRQVRIVGCFHPHHAQKKGSDHPSEGFAQGSLDPGRFQQLGLHCHQLCALEGLHVQRQTGYQGPRRGEGKWASPPAILCSRSLGRRCRGQACLEPAGHLPYANPASEAVPPRLHSPWLYGPPCSFWRKWMLLAQTNSPSILLLTCCCQNSVWRSWRQT